MEFDNVSFQNNQNYGKVYDDSHKFGGAIFMTATDLEKYEVTVRNCLFMGNSNKDGGCKLHPPSLFEPKVEPQQQS